MWLHAQGNNKVSRLPRCSFSSLLSPSPYPCMRLDKPDSLHVGMATLYWPLHGHLGCSALAFWEGNKLRFQSRLWDTSKGVAQKKKTNSKSKGMVRICHQRLCQTDRTQCSRRVDPQTKARTVIKTPDWSLKGQCGTLCWQN